MLIKCTDRLHFLSSHYSHVLSLRSFKLIHEKPQTASLSGFYRHLCSVVSASQTKQSLSFGLMLHLNFSQHHVCPQRSHPFPEARLQQLLPHSLCQSELSNGKPGNPERRKLVKIKKKKKSLVFRSSLLNTRQ